MPPRTDDPSASSKPKKEKHVHRTTQSGAIEKSRSDRKDKAKKHKSDAEKVQKHLKKDKKDRKDKEKKHRELESSPAAELGAVEEPIIQTRVGGAGVDDANGSKQVEGTAKESDGKNGLKGPSIFGGDDALANASKGSKNDATPKPNQARAPWSNGPKTHKTSSQDAEAEFNAAELEECKANMALAHAQSRCRSVKERAIKARTTINELKERSLTGKSDEGNLGVAAPTVDETLAQVKSPPGDSPESDSCPCVEEGEEEQEGLVYLQSEADVSPSATRPCTISDAKR